jgi:ketosteroid isomerase-like protein
MTSTASWSDEGADKTSQMTPARLLEALEQWNTHDVDAVMSYFAEECEYHASSGPSYVGRAAVREGVRSFFDAYPDGQFLDTEVSVCGDRGSAEWIFVSTNADGQRVSVRGCDLLEFDGPLLKRKNAFRKPVVNQS